MCCYDFRTTKIFEKLASFARLVGPLLLMCIPSYSNYYFCHALMQLFLYLFCVSGIHVKSFYGSRKTETIATKIQIPITKNSPSIIYESTEWGETSASISSESEIVPSFQFITKQPVTKKKRIENPIWKLGNLKKNKCEIDFTPAPNQETFENLLQDFANELSFFHFLFPVDILNDIMYETILYSMQERPEKPISITLDDMEKFIACALYMSVIKLPSTCDYWSSKLSVSCVSDLMGVNRFKEI